MSGNDLTEEELSNPNVIKLNMKPYNADLAKTTSFFTDYTPESILKMLTDSLTTSNTSYEISKNTWKVTYTKQRSEEESKSEETLVIREQAIIQIEL